MVVIVEQQTITLLVLILNAGLILLDLGLVFGSAMGWTCPIKTWMIFFVTALCFSAGAVIWAFIDMARMGLVAYGV